MDWARRSSALVRAPDNARRNRLLEGCAPRRGPCSAAISRAIVRIHAEHYGKGATQAKTYAFDNLIVTVLRDVFTTVSAR